jgi:hypothetical protein
MAETHKADVSSMLNSALSGGWEAARDALIPAAEDAAVDGEEDRRRRRASSRRP